MAEHGQTLKVKHSRHSQAQLGPAREALAVVHTLADDFTREVAELCNVGVNERDWHRFLDTHVRRTDKAGSPLHGRALTMAEKKRDTLERLFRYDPRVSPWRGTAHGVIQAVNTYEHHEGIVRGAQRPERNMLRAITGDVGRIDR